MIENEHKIIDQANSNLDYTKNMYNKHRIQNEHKLRFYGYYQDKIDLKNKELSDKLEDVQKEKDQLYSNQYID